MNGISVVLGDITKLKVDAIVNAADECMLGGGGVDGAIHHAAGPELRQLCYAIPEVRPGIRCPTGEARITDGCRLPAKYVVFTAGPIYRDGRHSEPELLANCYRHALELAYEKGARSIAFPSISTGVFGYPAEEAAPIAIREVKTFLAEHPDMNVTFCMFNGPRDRVDMKALYDRLLPTVDARRHYTDEDEAVIDNYLHSKGATSEGYLELLDKYTRETDVKFFDGTLIAANVAFLKDKQKEDK